MRRAAVVPEKAEQAHIVQLLLSIGARVYVMGTRRRRGDFQGTMQTEGIPDLMAFLPARHAATDPTCSRCGHLMNGQGGMCAKPECRCECLARKAWLFLFIEVKARYGRLRPEQAEFRELCFDADIEHRVGGLDDLIAWLSERGYVKPQAFPHYRQPKEIHS